MACIDRKGTGRYSIYLSNYANRWVSPPVGPCAMVEMDETQSNVSAGIIKIRNVAREVGVEGFTGESFVGSIFWGHLVFSQL